MEDLERKVSAEEFLAHYGTREVGEIGPPPTPEEATKLVKAWSRRYLRRLQGALRHDR